ncbi:MAG: glycosyltransferase [Spirochaetaceae bacterium]|nr:glycosyltransferase [Spirochaetaceae bacterium]
MSVTRIRLLSIPLDCIPIGELETTFEELLYSGKSAQICFVSIWDFLKAKVNKEYRAVIENAALIIPVSKSLLKAAAFLKLGKLVRYNQFSVVISFLRVIEQHYKTLYLLGGHKDTLLTSEKNIRSTFPSLHVVGRYVGFYPKNEEENLLEAIYKSSPSFLLVSEGIKNGMKWIYTHKEKFNSSIVLYYKEIFGIFAKQRKKISAEVFEKGNEIWFEIFRNPLKIFLFFPFLWFILLVAFEKLCIKFKK